MIGIRVDGNKKIGMGHIMRCLSIAEALRDIGNNSVFICARDSYIDIIKQKGFPVYVLDNYITNGFDISEIKQLEKLLNGKKITSILVDSYNVTLDYFRILHKLSKIIYIDDLNLFDYDVDIVINYNIEAKSEDYSHTAYKSRKAYTGVRYFPLRKELCIGGNHEIRTNVKNVLLTVGSTDPCECTKKILDSIEPNKYPDIHFSVLFGLFYSNQYKEKLNHDFSCFKNVEFLPWGQDMAKIYRSSDIVISPGSVTTYEALSLNTPCITFQFVDNQYLECINLKTMGMASWAGSYSSSDNNADSNMRMRKLFEYELNYETRLKHSRIYTKFFDCRGAMRIAKIICEVQYE